jgi:Tol biopolymer transport system component
MGVTGLSARVALASILVAVPLDAAAQYFGRNKVEYAEFNFRILATEHFDIYYYAGEEQAAQMAARLAERWHSRLTRVLRHELSKRQPLVLYGSQAEFAQTNVISGLLPDSVGGVTESSHRRIVMPFAPTLAETNHVLGHEIVHAFQYDIAERNGGGTGQPLWFIEGMAEYLAQGVVDEESSLWLRDAVLSDRLPHRQRDAAAQLSPYQYGHAFWSYLGQRFGDEVVEKALKPGKTERKLNDRMRSATGETLDALYLDWRASVQRTYGANGTPKAAAPKVRADGAGKVAAYGTVQLGPALSPDGKHAVFFSERDRLSIDLFLADVDAGRIVRKLATTAASARFDSLQPLRSAGAWSPNGEWFAFAAVRQGQAALLLLDMRNQGRDRELVFKELGQVLSPTWSPDGTAIAFSALAGGFTDLYLVDLSTGTLRRLTSDAFSDLQPAWSHDGRTIAFATERYSSDLTALRFGPPHLALLDVETAAVRPVDPDFGRAQLNPQWSTDDRDLYFVGDADGSRNVFRIGLASSTVRQLTKVATGVSGVTPTSPALSVAGDGSVVAFTVYRTGRPQLVVLDEPEEVSGEPVAERAPSNLGDSPEPSPAGGLVNLLLTDDQSGLPDSSSIVGRDYRSRLALEGIGQPYLSSGGGPFGTFVRGGGAVLFGDMLGERRLGAAVQVGNHLRDAAFAFRFLNQKRRWNWGGIAELEPGIGRYRRTEAIQHEGAPALLRQADYLQRMQLRTAALVAYPFSRGLRLEFTAGVRHATYHRDVTSEISSAETGRVLARDHIEASGGRPTTMAEVGAALVHDTTVFGPTGPLLGSRYRFEIAPAVGDLSYTRVIADYRRYLMPVRPYSLALRVLHSARYGSDGDDPRLLSSFLGSSYLVRGHRLDRQYCRPDPPRACGDELLGSRLLVGNVELRFPVWGILARQLDYGPLPADVFFFADGGMVWSGPGRAIGISSVGGGIRLNGGGLPVEIAAVRALDGPAPRWQFELGFRVGF